MNILWKSLYTSQERSLDCTLNHMWSQKVISPQIRLVSIGNTPHVESGLNFHQIVQPLTKPNISHLGSGSLSPSSADSTIGLMYRAYYRLWGKSVGWKLCSLFNLSQSPNISYPGSSRLSPSSADNTIGLMYRAYRLWGKSMGWRLCSLLKLYWLKPLSIAIE